MAHNSQWFTKRPYRISHRSPDGNAFNSLSGIAAWYRSITAAISPIQESIQVGHDKVRQQQRIPPQKPNIPQLAPPKPNKSQSD